MTVIKAYNSTAAEWEPVVVGKQGPQGPTGATGATGPQGPEGGTTTLTTKGDLLTRDASAVARLPVGATDGLSLVTDSSVSTGLKYEQRARIINTDGDPGVTIYVGSVDPDVSYTPATGDVWIETP